MSALATRWCGTFSPDSSCRMEVCAPVHLRLSLLTSLKRSATQMAKLGFLGLGIMGGPMALRLIEAGHQVALWSFSEKKVAALADKGGIACATPAEVARQSDCTFLCVGDTEMSRSVILGADGLVEGAAAKSIIVDCSTIAPSASRAIAAELAKKDVSFLDAPCTGSKAGAEGGTLTFMVGGPKVIFEKVRPYFEIMGK